MRSSYSFCLTALTFGIFLMSCSRDNGLSQKSESQTSLTLITYNIKNDYDKTGPNNWTERKSAMGSFLVETAPSFLGVQEALHNQVTYLDSVLVNHKYIGVGRDDGEETGEYCAIYFDTSAYNFIAQKTIWLSPTPNENSKGWDAAFPRIATFGLFSNKTNGDSLLVVNTHFDHVGKQARAESAKVIYSEIQRWDVAQAILMGDLNATINEAPIQYLKQALLNTNIPSLNTNRGPVGTFNGFNQNYEDRVIDYIFLKGFSESAVKRYEHLDPRLSDGNFVSDHFAVVAEIDF